MLAATIITTLGSTIAEVIAITVAGATGQMMTGPTIGQTAATAIIITVVTMVLLAANAESMSLVPALESLISRHYILIG